MATKQTDGRHIISAGEVAAFSVCPLSWKLKWIDGEDGNSTPSVVLGQELHDSWSRVFEESLILGRWIRYLSVLITAAIVIFLFIHPSAAPFGAIFSGPFGYYGVQLIVLSAATFFVIRSFVKAARRKRSDSGFTAHEVAVAMEGSTLVPPREYISLKHGLAGKPDALVREGEETLPVERKPLAKKLRDRYVAQLLVYMRLVEEFEGRRPSCGYLILGPDCKRVVVHNTEAKQRWLDSLLGEMRGVLDGAEARATPHGSKCSKCSVRERCAFRADGDWLR